MAGMYNLFSGAQRKTFVQFILGGARKKVFVHKKMQPREFIVMAREIRTPRGRSEFFFKKICKSRSKPLSYTHDIEKNGTKASQGGG